MTAQRRGSRERTLPLPGWDVCALVLAVAVQGGIALWLGGRGWFSGDLIHYYVERGGAPGGSESLMDPHSAHWQLTLVLVYLLLFKLFGLTTYVPYLAITVLVHLLLVLVVHRLLLRLGSGRLPALLCALALLSYGAGSEAFLIEAPVALTSSMLLGAVALIVLVRRDHDLRGTLLAGLLLLVGVTVSLGGVVAAVWVGVFALSRGFRHMVQMVVLPALAFLGWYAVWGRGSSRVLLSREEVLDVPEAAARLVTVSLDNLSGGWGAGAATVLAIGVAAALCGRRRPPLVHATVAGLVAAAFHAVVSAVAQLPYGIDQVTTSRYQYVVLVLLLPGLALLLDVLVTRAAAELPGKQRLPALVAATVVVCLLGVHAARGQQQVAQRLDYIGEVTLGHLGGAVLATGAGEKVLNDSVPGSYISGEDLVRLAGPDLRSELPTLDPTEQDRIDAESRYFVEVTGDELDLAPPAELETDSFDPVVSGRPGCRTYTATNGTPTFVLTSYLGAGFRFRGDAEHVTTVLSRPGHELTSDPIQWRTSPEEWTYVATTAQLAELAVTFDSAGDYTFCFAS